MWKPQCGLRPHKKLELVARRQQAEQVREDLRGARAILAKQEEELKQHQETCRNVEAEVVTLKVQWQEDQRKLLMYQDKLAELEETTQGLAVKLQQTNDLMTAAQLTASCQATITTLQSTIAHLGSKLASITLQYEEVVEEAESYKERCQPLEEQV